MIQVSRRLYHKDMHYSSNPPVNKLMRPQSHKSTPPCLTKPQIFPGVGFARLSLAFCVPFVNTGNVNTARGLHHGLHGVVFVCGDYMVWRGRVVICDAVWCVKILCEVLGYYIRYYMCYFAVGGIVVLSEVLRIFIV